MGKPDWYLKLPTDLIDDLAKKYQIDGDLIAAIAQHESLGVKWKTRYEPTTERYVLSYREYASHLGISAETERVAQMHSYGLMQVMGFLARQLGFKDYLGKLCIADIGMDLGCQFLKKLMQRYGQDSVTDVISAYNQGSAKKSTGGMYLNQRAYVDPVYGLLMELRKLD